MICAANGIAIKMEKLARNWIYLCSISDTLLPVKRFCRISPVPGNTMTGNRFSPQSCAVFLNMPQNEILQYSYSIVLTASVLHLCEHILNFLDAHLL